MRDVLLVRFGEVHLKGLNRPYFLRKLVENIKFAVRPLGGHVWMSDGRIYVSGAQDMREVTEKVCRVFGVYSVSVATELEKDLEEIARAGVALARPLTGTFKIEARRSDKRFQPDSMTMGRELGGRVLEANPNLRVDVHRPQHRISVEIRDMAYVYCGETLAEGGMPLGTGGRAALLLSGGIDSPVAGYQIMRRGVTLRAIHFFSFPFTSERARQKVIDLAAILGAYGGGMPVDVVPFTKIQMEIHEKCPDEFGTLIMRRFMMRIAEKLARRRGCLALITGENLGQVASQTMEALAVTDRVVDMPVFRPLIGLDKLEITQMAERIGTYETSILPYEDCCTVFTPRHPATKPHIADIEKAEALLDCEGLIDEAVAGTEEVRYWVREDGE
jgi:thiamine biosynthesis protein ThiI